VAFHTRTAVFVGEAGLNDLVTWTDGSRIISACWVEGFLVFATGPQIRSLQPSGDSGILKSASGRT
jgi:hypothetical protein